MNEKNFEKETFLDYMKTTLQNDCDKNDLLDILVNIADHGIEEAKKSPTRDEIPLFLSKMGIAEEEVVSAFTHDTSLNDLLENKVEFLTEHPEIQNILDNYDTHDEKFEKEAFLVYFRQEMEHRSEAELIEKYVSIAENVIDEIEENSHSKNQIPEFISDMGIADESLATAFTHDVVLTETYMESKTDFLKEHPDIQKLLDTSQKEH